MSEMVERVARAICVARGRDPDGRTGFVCDSSPPHYVKHWETARGEARAAIEAMRSDLMERSVSRYFDAALKAP